MADLRLGNCLDVMKSIPSGSIDAIITDPPYGTTACKWDSVIPFEPDRKSVV
jgi:site-specific DNA-methyltransferase (adenine-specific)